MARVLPLEADPREGGKDEVAQDCFETERREALVEYLVHGGLVVVVDRGKEA